jgi:hypothetical protein
MAAVSLAPRSPAVAKSDDGFPQSLHQPLHFLEPVVTEERSPAGCSDFVPFMKWHRAMMTSSYRHSNAI